MECFYAASQTARRKVFQRPRQIRYPRAFREHIGDFWVKLIACLHGLGKSLKRDADVVP